MATKGEEVLLDKLREVSHLDGRRVHWLRRREEGSCCSEVGGEGVFVVVQGLRRINLEARGFLLERFRIGYTIGGGGVLLLA